MTTSVEKFESLWTKGYPPLRERFFLSSVIPMTITTLIYVTFVLLIGPAIMKNRKPIQLRKIMIGYNFGLVAFYVYFLVKGFILLPRIGVDLFCGSLVENKNPVIPELFELGYQLYIVRFIEYLDTVFLVMSKKFNMITLLHVFHHSIVPVFGWFGFRAETSGYHAVFMALNSIVHVIMYTYYAIAALGPEYQKYVWWKKYITKMQIMQFFIMTIYMIVMNWFGCTDSKVTFYFSIILTVLFFFLFIDYYRKCYNKGKANKETSNGVHKNGAPTAYLKDAKKD